MTFIPFIGFLLYLLFGHGPIMAKKATFLDEVEEREYQETVEWQLKKLMNRRIHFPYLSFIIFNLNYNKSLVMGAKTFTYFNDAKEKYEALLADILNAKYSIHVL